MLEQIAEPRHAKHRLRVCHDELWVAPERPAVHFGGYAAHVVVVDVAPRCRELPDHGGFARYHDRARRGRCQYELSACVAMLMGELLSDPAPHETPATSTCRYPSWATTPAASFASVDGR